SMEVFLSLEMQNLLLTYQRIFFVLTSFLSVITMTCLLTKTPQSQAGIRAYLLYIQVRFFKKISVYLDVLFAPIPAFPALGGYCLGPLCMAGIRAHSVLMNRSPASLKRQRQSLVVLFVQIAVPLIMIIVPAFILFTSLACQCIPFRVTLPAYCVLIFHPLAHNLILLSVTPAYRRFILKHI
ncbi:hypothetical protein PMAYCL1PPCAC_13752, partial [Pristionchus mayeri]